MGIVGVPEEEDAVAGVGGGDEGFAEEVGDWHKGEGEGDAEDGGEVEGEAVWGGHFGGGWQVVGCCGGKLVGECRRALESGCAGGSCMLIYRAG